MKKGDFIEFHELAAGQCPIVHSDDGRIGVKVFKPAGPVTIYLKKSDLITTVKKRVGRFEGEKNHFFLYRVAPLPEEIKMKYSGVFYAK